jgi:MoaA/NifB/PqqE/SkfB family radical SAM enzyme
MLKTANRLNHGRKEYQDYFVVNWCFFSICNFSCSYCPEELHDGKNRGLPIDVVKKFCLKVIKQKADKKVFFEFTGGEVTYHKNFVELFTFLKNNGAETGLISNGSRDIEFWKKNKHLIDHICLSFHPEQGDADHFYEVVKLLSEEATVHVNIMMLPEKFDKLHDLAKKISSEIADVSIAMQALFENINGKIYGYTPEQKDILDYPKLPWGENILHHPKPSKIRKVYRGEMVRSYTDGSSEVINTPELIARGENKWFGWECHIGVENLVVDYYGNVMRGWCGIGGIIGNVSGDDFDIPTKPITCMAKVCHCGLDIMATKEVL